MRISLNSKKKMGTHEMAPEVNLELGVDPSSLDEIE